MISANFPFSFTSPSFAVSTIQSAVGFTNKHSSQRTHLELSITGAGDLASSNLSKNIDSSETPASLRTFAPASIIGGGPQKKALHDSAFTTPVFRKFSLKKSVTKPLPPSQSESSGSSLKTGINLNVKPLAHFFSIAEISSTRYKSFCCLAP